MNPTIDKINDFSLQQIFDFVANHLLTQGQKSLSVDGLCRYRSDKGLMCAIGSLIPDHIYSTSIEGSIVRDVLYDLNISVEISRLRLLNRLQVIHDSYVTDRWKSELLLLAKELHLTFNYENQYESYN